MQTLFPEHHLTHIIPDVTNTLGQVQDKNLHPNPTQMQRVSSLQAKPIKAEAKFETGMSLCNGSSIDSRFKLKTSLAGSGTSYLDAHMQHALLRDHANPKYAHMVKFESKFYVQILHQCVCLFSMHRAHKYFDL
jgi:hypothetical protein